MERKRALWLIDGSYLYKARSSCGQQFSLDYIKLRNYIERDGKIWRAYYLNSTPNPPSDDQDKFHNFLRSASPGGPGIVTKLYELKQTNLDKGFCEQCDKLIALTCPEDKTQEKHRLYKEQQKGVDVGIATLTLTHMDQYDTLILSSGDGDLLDAIEHVSSHKKNFELVVIGKNTVSTELQARADRIYWIDEFSREVCREHA